MNPSENSDEGCTRFTLQARTKVPTIEKGMTYAKYKTNVDMWKHAMKGCMSEKSMGMALLQSLPNEDNRRGIKEQAWKKLGKAELTCKDGVDNLLQFLEKKLLRTDFVRCIELNDKHTAIKHQEGWSIDKYIADPANLGTDSRPGILSPSPNEMCYSYPRVEPNRNASSPDRKQAQC